MHLSYEANTFFRLLWILIFKSTWIKESWDNLAEANSMLAVVTLLFVIIPLEFHDYYCYIAYYGISVVLSSYENSFVGSPSILTTLCFSQ